MLATRGDRLVLARVRWEGATATVGPSEIEWLDVIEVDDHGERVAEVNFDPDDLDAAYAELDERYAAGEAAPYARAEETLRAAARPSRRGTGDSWLSLFAPDFVWRIIVRSVG